MTTEQARNLTDGELDAILGQFTEPPVERRLSHGDRAAMVRWFGCDRRQPPCSKT